MKIVWAVAFAFTTASVVAQDVANHSTGNHTDCAKPPSNKYEEKMCTCKTGCSFVVGCKEGYEGVSGCRPRQAARNECASRDSCTGHDADTRPTDATSFPVNHIRSTASWNNLTVVSPDGAADPEPLVSPEPVGSATTTALSPMNESSTTPFDTSSEGTITIARLVIGIVARLLAPIVVLIVLKVLRWMKSRRKEFSLDEQYDAGKGMLSHNTEELARDLV